MYSNLHKNQQKYLSNLGHNPGNIYNSNEELSFIQTINSLTPIQLRVLDELLLLDEKYARITIKQKTLAAMLGVTREYINKTIKELVALNLITSGYRHMRSSIYTICAYLKDPGTCIRFKHLLKTYRYRSRRIALYASIGSQGRKQFTQYNNLKELIITKSTSLALLNTVTFFNNTPETQQLVRTSTELEVIFSQTRGDAVKPTPLSPLLSTLVSSYGFSQTDVTKLEHVPDDVIRYAMRVFDTVDRHSLIHPFGYFCGIIRNYKSDLTTSASQKHHKRVYERSSGTRDIYRICQERVYDPIEIANGITVLKNQDALDKLARLMGKEAAVKYRDLVLSNWLCKKIEYNEENEAHRVAMHYINKYKELVDDISFAGKPR